MTGILEAVLNSLWQTLAIAAAAWVALRIPPRMQAAAQYTVWWGVLAIVLALPIASYRRDSIPSPATAGLPATLAAPIASAPAEPESTGAAASARPIRSAPPYELHTGSWIVWTFAIWSAVCLFHLWQICRSYLYLRGLKQRAQLATREQRLNFDAWLLTCRIRRPVRLLLSNEIVSPMAVGFLHPAVILPAGLVDEFAEKELDHVLLHELAHISRRDDWTNLAARLAAAALTLHPVAAWVLRRIDREREIACDDWVVAATGEARPYAASLARLFELCSARRREPLATGMADRASLLGERIEALLRSRPQASLQGSAGRMAASAVLLLALVMAIAQTPRWVAFAQRAPAPSAPPTPRAPVAPRAVPVSAQSPAVPGPRGSLLAELVAAGYGDLPVDDIINLKNNGISGDFIRETSQAGWGKLKPGQLIDLHNSGVTPQYLREIGDAGMKGLDIREVIDIRNSGVLPAYIDEIHSLGFGPYRPKQIIELSQHGVAVDLFRALKEAGFTNPDVREVMEAHSNGLRASNLREARNYGASLTLRQIIRLKQAGVI